MNPPSATMHGPAQAVRLAAFPYPFRAALAICSDIDHCDRERFLAVHRVLNRELGLPVADSFFGWAPDASQVALFTGPDVTPSPDTGFILDALEAGLMDALHSWGDCNEQAPESVIPRVIPQAGAVLLRAGVRVPVWINHGSPGNHQNLRARLEPDYVGDVPSSPLYSADVLRSLGVQWCWVNEIVPWPLYALHVPLATRLSRHGRNAAKNLVKRLLGRAGRCIPSAMLHELCIPMALRDGTTLDAFARCNLHPEGRWGLPTRHTLRYGLQAELLDLLEAEQGYIVVYTHLGMPPIPAAAGPELFPEPDRLALEDLARRYAEGRIWVAPTARLLAYQRMVRGLQWQATEKDGKLFIEISGVRTSQGVIPLEPDQAHGLTFLCDEPSRCVLRLSGRDVATRVVEPAGNEPGRVELPLASAPDLSLLGT